MVNGKVIQRTIEPDGQVTGTYDNNPFLNSIIYDVEFPDGQVKEYAANIISENMLRQVDSDGMSTTLWKRLWITEGMIRRHFNIMTSMFKPRIGGATLERPQRVGSYSSSGRTSLNPG